MIGEPSNIAREGFSIHPGVFAPAEMQTVVEALGDAALPRTRAGARHVLGVPAVRSLALDPRMAAIARDYLGPTVIPYRATLFDKSAAANWLVVWHQDTALPIVQRVDHPAWGPWSVKRGVLCAIAPAAALEHIVALRVHLDDSTRDNGPLRVLPGSHDRGLLADAEIHALAAAIPAVECLASAGGVVAMRPLTVHASSKATSDHPRRVMHIEFSSTLDLRNGVTLAQG